MSPEFIAAAREEEASLDRKLQAVRAMLAAYGEEVAPAVVPKASPLVKVLATRRAAADRGAPKAWGERPKDQYTAYGQTAVDAAIAVVRAAEIAPIKTREIVERLQAENFDIRGNDPVNALGALLARSSQLVSHGKRGWALAEPYGIVPPNENAPPSTAFDDVLGGAETAQDALAEGDHRNEPSFLRVAGAATP